jgi:hypothetical protein
LVPMEFPLLVIVPALVLDALWPKFAAWNKWAQAAAAGAIFVVAFTAVQWPWADFLMSTRSANWVFGTNYFAYFDSPNGYDFCRLFFPAEPTRARFWLVMAEALVCAILSSRLGLAWGEWVQKIRR